MRYFIQFSYRGSNYHGSQTQPNGITVQEVLERALETILRISTPLIFAGRTDAGVHAEMMYAHFESEIEPSFLTDTLPARLNNLLPADIAIRTIVPVANEAHARFNALSRTYEYRIIWRKDVFKKGLITRVAPGLDFERMNEAAGLLLGKQDFASFCRIHTDVKTTLCDVRYARWSVDTDKQEAVFTIQADRFLRNMVRAVVGTLFEVGRHHTDMEGLRKIIAGKNRSLAGNSVSPDGLYLVDIHYPEELFLKH